MGISGNDGIENGNSDLDFIGFPIFFKFSRIIYGDIRRMDHHHQSFSPKCPMDYV